MRKVKKVSQINKTSKRKKKGKVLSGPIKKVLSCEGSVRVDLLGGTLDIHPINLILKNVVTLNLATGLKAKVTLEKTHDKLLTIHSLDYGVQKSFRKDDFDFGHLEFIILIVRFFGIRENLKLTLSSGAPPGSGLGGSSSMGVVLFKALSLLTKRKFLPEDAIRIVLNIESRMLSSGPAGYQDYYPALYGGILALFPSFDSLKVCQLYKTALARFLESHLTLVYSGETRFSGMNNWEVYKKFFDKDEKTREGLQKIADFSQKAFEAINEKNYDELLEFIKEEGRQRMKLFPNILSQEMASLYKKLEKRFPSLGIKVCGAGGGGCFLLIHKVNEKRSIASYIEKENMKVLDFKIMPPLST